MTDAGAAARTQIWSFGGGTQTAAIAVLILQGHLPKPDLAVISDTEREKSKTWSYLQTVVQPALDAIGLPVHRVRKSEYELVDLYGPQGDILIPIWRAGGTVRLPGHCSDRWKKRVIMRWARAQGVQQADCWIGYSLDERRRIKTAKERWWQLRYPLIDRFLGRGDCVRLVEAYGWPPPPKSTCWMCPRMSNTLWRELRDESPDDFAKALMFDEQLREEDSNAYIHRSGVPLAVADLEAEDDRQVTLGCDGGDCFV